MPVSLGSASRSSRNASSPPADAPMPTTGTSTCTGWGAGGADGTGFLSAVGFVALCAGFPGGTFFGIGLKDYVYFGYSTRIPPSPKQILLDYLLNYWTDAVSCG